jgi:hypothetical protein
MKRLIVISCFTLSACATGGQTGDEGRFNQDGEDAGLPKVFEVKETRVIVPPPYKLPCRADAECVLVDTSCAGCCAIESINTSAEAAFRAAFADACGGYSGPVCDCAPQHNAAACVEGACTPVGLGGF